MKRYTGLKLAITAIIILLVGNLLRYRRILAPQELFAIFALIALYFTFFNIVFRWIIELNRKKSLLAVLLLIGILFTAESFCKWVIYTLYPQMDLILYKKDIPFNEVQFRLRIDSSLRTVFLVTLLYRHFRYWQKHTLLLEAKMKKNRELLAELSYQLALRNIAPHFVESILSTGIGRSLMNKGNDNAEMLIDLNQILRYVLDQDRDGMNMVLLAKEWSYVLDLINILKWKYGDDKIRIDQRGNSNVMQRNIIPLLLISILENAIKYAQFGRNPAIWITMITTHRRFTFECHNHFDPIMRNSLRSTGFGIKNMKARLQRLDSRSQLQIAEKGDIFSLELDYEFDKIKMAD